MVIVNICIRREPANMVLWRQKIVEALLRGHNWAQVIKGAKFSAMCHLEVALNDALDRSQRVLRDVVQVAPHLFSDTGGDVAVFPQCHACYIVERYPPRRSAGKPAHLFLFFFVLLSSFVLLPAT